MRYKVCKTVVSFPQKPRYLLFPDEAASFLLQGHETLEQLAADVQSACGTSSTLFIKNEAPGDIIWQFNGIVRASVRRCERLSEQEVHDLMRLIVR